MATVLNFDVTCHKFRAFRILCLGNKLLANEKQNKSNNSSRHVGLGTFARRKKSVSYSPSSLFILSQY
jgi:hypothetical protein